MLFSILLTVPLFMDHEWGYSDTDSNSAYGAMGATLAFYSVVIGPFVERLGVKWTLFVSGILSVFAGLLIILSPESSGVSVGLIMLLPLSAAMAIPAARMAIGLYEPEDKQPGAYATFFWMLMVTQAITYAIVDIIMHAADDDVIGLDHYRQIIALGVLLSLLTLLLSLFITNKSPEASQDDEEKPGFCKAVCAAMKEKTYRKFIILIMINFGARFAYAMMEVMLPKYMRREIDSSAMYGLVAMANPLTQICFISVLARLPGVFTNYTWIIVGAAILCATTFIPMMASHYAVFVLYCIGLGIGQSIFMHFLWAYTMEIVPEG